VRVGLSCSVRGAHQRLPPCATVAATVCGGLTSVFHRAQQLQQQLQLQCAGGSPASSTVRNSCSWSSKPKVPRRLMYPRLDGSDAPVAEQYTTRALGRAACSATTTSAVWEGLPLVGSRFLAL
jgi:hypothetical protein